MSRLLLFTCSLLSVLFSAQSNTIIGTVVSEFGDKLPNTLVINMRSEDRVMSDKDGNFLIKAISSDELRFIRTNYERSTLSVKDGDFSRPTVIKLKALEYLIPELELGFVPTGNLKKDVLRLETVTDRKVASLNNNLNKYMKSNPNYTMPKNNAGNSFNSGADLSKGSLDIGGLANGLSQLLSSNSSSNKTTATYSERETFYRKVRAVIDVDYFANAGIVDYDLDRLIAFADVRYDLAKIYRNNFNKSKIEEYLKLAMTDFKINNSKKKVN